jgi:competence protein ComEC
VRIDARLLVPAAGVWLGAAVTRTVLAQSAALVSRHDAAQSLAWCAAAGVIAVLGVFGVGLVRRGWSARPLMRTASAIALSAILVGALAAALNVAALTAAPMGAWVDAHATAEVSGVVVTEPRVRTMTGTRIWQQASVVELRLASDRVTARGSAVAVELPVLLRLPMDLAIPAPGTHVIVSGRLGPSSGQSDAVASMRVRAVRITDGPGVIDTVAHRMRTGLAASLAGTSPDAGSLVAGLAVGDDSAQPVALGVDMRTSGLSHLTAVSGGNVAIVLAVVLGLVILLRLPLGARIAAALAALAFFVILVGPQPSVLRAGGMGAIATVGLLTGGRRAGPAVLGAGILLLILLAPWLATSWGFALSAMATAGLIVIAGPVADRLARWRWTWRWPPALREALALTVSAQLATLPVLVSMGGTVGWVALPANLVVMPVVAPVTILGLVAAGISPLVPGAAAVVAQLAAWPAAWIAWVAHVGAGLPLAVLPWPTGWWGLGLLAVTALIGIGITRLRRALIPRGPSRPVGMAMALTLVAALGVLLVHPPGRRGWPPPGWFIIMCDVGQGDALLLRAGEGAAVVIDSGPEPNAVDACLTDAGISAVPAVVLTHFHADHVGGLSGVLRHRSIGEVLVNPIRDPVEEAVITERLLATTGIASGLISAGDVRTIGDVGWRAIWPRRRIDAGSVPNNASVVLVVTIAGRHLLLAGDVEPEAQDALMADLRGQSFDVVKVPHHGSRNQSPRLLEAAPAPVALISVGAGNDYGHPAPDTVAAWREIGAVVMRTDLDGEIAVVSTGTGVGVVTRHGMLPSS